MNKGGKISEDVFILIFKEPGKKFKNLNFGPIFLVCFDLILRLNKKFSIGEKGFWGSEIPIIYI